MTSKITYNLLNTNLYNFENIGYDSSKELILDNFKCEYENKIKKALLKLGLKYINLSFYSPKYYNYEGDSIDLTITVQNKNKLKKYIVFYKVLLDKKLSENKSYDGYIALTVDSVSTELDNIKKDNYEPDVIILIELLNKLTKFKEFDYKDYLIFEDDIEEVIQ